MARALVHIKGDSVIRARSRAEFNAIVKALLGDGAISRLIIEGTQDWRIDTPQETGTPTWRKRRKR